MPVNYTFMILPITIKKSLLLPVLALFTVLQANAQLSGVKNLPKYDFQKIHFGFTLGLNFSDLKVNLVPDFRTIDSIYVIESEPVAGLNLGIIANLRIGNHFDLRFIPALSFAQRNLVYSLTYLDTLRGVSTKNVESNYLEFPVELKFKSERIRNYRVYVLAGFKYSFDMISQASVATVEKEIVKLKKADYGYEIGFGFDFYMPYFKFSPEIKMYQGLNNLLVKDGRPLSNPLEGLFSKVFTLSFTFE